MELTNGAAFSHIMCCFCGKTHTRTLTLREVNAFSNKTGTLLSLNIICSLIFPRNGDMAITCIENRRKSVIDTVARFLFVEPLSFSES